MIILGLQYWREKRAQTALQMALLKVNSLHRRSCALEKALLAADTRASSRMLRWAEEQHLQIGAAMMISVRIMQWRRRMLRKRAQTTLPTGETAAAPAAARKGPLSLACINWPASEEFIVLRSLSSSHLTEESSSSPLRATPASPLIRSPLGFSPRLERRAHSQLECIIQESAEASPTPETDQAALDLYSKYAGDECLPIEVVTNLALLLLKARRVIQFDMGFYDAHTQGCIHTLVDRESCGLGSNEASPIHSMAASASNVVLYLKEDQAVIEQAIEAAGGVGSAGYARLLDPTFYVSKSDVKSVYSNHNLSMVSINVVKGKCGCSDCRSGALLVQMLAPDEVDEMLPAMYSRFVYFKQLIIQLDADAQAAFKVYTKRGDWDAQPDHYKV